MNRILGTLVLAIVLLAASVVAAPWYVVHQLRSAAKAGDSAELSRHVDFPALRDSVKASFKAALAEQAAASPDGNNDFAAMLFAALVDPMVEALITPENLAQMMSGAAPAEPADPQAMNQPAPPASEIRTGYEDMDHFAMALRLVESGKEPVVFLLRRDGLWTWKLASMRLDTPALAPPPPPGAPGIP